VKVVKAPFPILCNIWLSTITVYLFKVLARKHARKKLPFTNIFFTYKCLFLRRHFEYDGVPNTRRTISGI
jgi:hypothetical protein